ncbi:UDP-2,3-diacylglucosamine diphosphatase [uncultured Cytophaga sp.]|uniref:UDP-2,3-diacylglucosamine diphosphatase n=1 Tax=uncultured Cytophaga sp. TaxID=160238 RepID=UPI0026338893|nr:UDP-2,3-diacylglucosamine diphosphatase [uncultured Cytophaga sp.]
MTQYIETVQPGKKIFFLSDFHLGVPNHKESREREDKIIRFLDSITPDAQAVFLLGDIFDFWFEYKHVIPKGFIRLQGKIARLTDAGIPVYMYTGNHDLWMFGYFEKELGAKVFYKPIDWEIAGKKFLIGHGDGLGPGDHIYKCTKKVFVNPFFQWLFKMTPPAIGMGIAKFWSGKSRLHNSDETFFAEKEFLWQYCNQQHTILERDFYIFGHRHLPLDLKVGEHSRYVNIGDWIGYNTYAEFDGETLKLIPWIDPLN